MRIRKGAALVVGAMLAVAAAGACTRPGGGGGGGITVPGGGGGGGGNVQERTVTYGPHAIPGVNQPAAGPFAAIAPLLGGQSGTGMIWNKPVVNVQKPCTDCYITEITADMETTDGQNANIDRGLWLHHMVLLVSGQGRRDATCASGLQQVAVGRANAERLWASGNERTRVMVGGDQGIYGYKVNAADQFHLILDLMNQNEARTNVNIKLKYKYVQGANARKNVRPVWLDANGCGVSEVPAKTGQYTVKTAPWTSNVSGPIIHTGGHIHDGGTNMTIEKGGQVICDSKAGYGETPEFIGGGHGHEGGGEMPGMDHGDGGGGVMSISSMSSCENVGTITAGQRLSGTAYYDDSKHDQMEHGGKLHTVMAIALVYIGQ